MEKNGHIVSEVRKVKFIDNEHKRFFETKITEILKNKPLDVYKTSLIYVLGICEITRKNFYEIFDVKKEEIQIEALKGAWQTSSSSKVTRLAFNLYSQWCYDSDDDCDKDIVSPEYNTSNIFCCSYAPYFYEGVKIRFPEYTISKQCERFNKKEA